MAPSQSWSTASQDSVAPGKRPASVAAQSSDEAPTGSRSV